MLQTQHSGKQCVLINVTRTSMLMNCVNTVLMIINSERQIII